MRYSAFNLNLEAMAWIYSDDGANRSPLCIHVLMMKQFSLRATLAFLSGGFPADRDFALYLALSVSCQSVLIRAADSHALRCGARGVGVRLEVHHRFPFAAGGSDHLSNLEESLLWCTRGQSDTMV